MAHISISGNVSADPHISFGQSGEAFCAFTVAHTTSKKEGERWEDGPTIWVKVKTFGKLAEQCGDSIAKGNRVVVTGKLTADSWEKDGQTRTDLVCLADDVGLSPLFASVSVSRASRASQRPSDSAGGGDPWGSAPGDDLAPPF